jgi:hypothetical protein
MGLRFRRSWGVVPGVRLNLGLKSGSVSFGVRGLHYTVGTRGQQVTVGLPGTGLYWTQKINSPIGTAQAGRTNQAPGYVQPARAGSPHVRVVNQAAQVPGAQTVHPPQLTRPNQSPMHPGAQTLRAPQFIRPSQSPMRPPSVGGAAQSAPAPLRQVFVPTWLVWAVLGVIVIAGLCFCAATIGQLLH